MLFESIDEIREKFADEHKLYGLDWAFARSGSIFLDKNHSFLESLVSFFFQVVQRLKESNIWEEKQEKNEFIDFCIYMI